MISALWHILKHWYHGMHRSASSSSMTHSKVLFERSDALQSFQLNDHLTWITTHTMASTVTETTRGIAKIHWWSWSAGEHLCCRSTGVFSHQQFSEYKEVAVCVYNFIYNWSLFNKTNFLSVDGTWQNFKKQSGNSMRSQWEAHAGLQGLGSPSRVVAGSCRELSLNFSLNVSIAKILRQVFSYQSQMLEAHIHVWRGQVWLLTPSISLCGDFRNFEGKRRLSQTRVIMIVETVHWCTLWIVFDPVCRLVSEDFQL